MNQSIYFAMQSSEFGKMLVAKSAIGLCAVFFGEDEADLVDDLYAHFRGYVLEENKTQCQSSLNNMLKMLKHHQPFSEPLDIKGTPFQRRVWQVIQQIPSGEVLSYTDVAKKVGAPRAARAVANACAANKLAIIIPCHRVIRQDGTLSGYRWGAHLRRRLLEHEAQ
jgi:AraC family transcriptional regulator, regulatory protein of adaptative response / methylated-DNA-[protein]-cysteine methyltransferase